MKTTISALLFTVILISCIPKTNKTEPVADSLSVKIDSASVDTTKLIVKTDSIKLDSIKK